MVRGQFGADNSALGGWKTDAWTLGKHSWFNYCMALSVTRLADFFHFEQQFKAGGNKKIYPNLPTLFGNFCKGVKNYHLSSEVIFGQLL